MKKRKKNHYDNAYKYLFSNKRIFLQLLKSFVYEDFINDIDIDSIEIVNKSFVSEDFLDRESDLIYRIKFNDKEYLIYILLEFQSTVDKSIPIRMFSYMLLLYDLIYKNSKKGLLPNIFPILLYNGQNDWTIPANISDLIEKNIPEKYIPSFEYYPIIEKAISDKTLDHLHNLVAAVIYLEKQKDENKITEAIDKVIEFIKNENIIDIRIFTLWLKKMFRASVSEEQIEKINNIKEAKSMITLLAEKIEKKGKIEGKIEDAKVMLQDGFTIEQVMKYTGLSREDVIKLTTDERK